MDNLSDSIVSGNNIEPSFSSSNAESFSFFDGLQNMNLTTWLIIILILSFLGFNVFVYLETTTIVILFIKT